MYDPAAGRFCGRDSIGFKAGSNLFQYVRAKPLFSVDPLGLEDEVPSFPWAPVIAPTDMAQVAQTAAEQRAIAKKVVKNEKERMEKTKCPCGQKLTSGDSEWMQSHRVEIGNYDVLNDNTSIVIQNSIPVSIGPTEGVGIEVTIDVGTEIIIGEAMARYYYKLDVERTEMFCCPVGTTPRNPVVNNPCRSQGLFITDADVDINYDVTAEIVHIDQDIGVDVTGWTLGPVSFSF